MIEVEELDTRDSAARNRNHKTQDEDIVDMNQDNDKEYLTDLLVHIKGISRTQIDFQRTVAKIYDDFGDEFETMLQSNTGFTISRVILRSSLAQTAETVDVMNSELITNDEKKNILKSKVALMFYMETLVLLAVLYTCYFVRKVRQRAKYDKDRKSNDSDNEDTKNDKVNVQNDREKFLDKLLLILGRVRRFLGRVRHFFD